MRKRCVLTAQLAEFQEIAAKSNYKPKQLARLLGVSLRSLQRECREYLGMRPMQLLNFARMRKAEHLLSKGNLAKQIFDQLNYIHPQSFGRSFKNSTRLTIRQFQAALSHSCDR